MENIIHFPIRPNKRIDPYTYFLTSLERYFNSKGNPSDFRLHNQLNRAYRLGWSYINYIPLLVKDRELLEEAGFIIEDLGSHFKITIPNEVRERCKITY